MNRLTARIRITLGLTSILLSVLSLAALLGLIPDRQAEVRVSRRKLSETIALTGSDYISRGEFNRAERMLTELVDRNKDLLSAGIRLESGQLLTRVGTHEGAWGDFDGEKSTDSHVIVPVYAKSQRWGQIELAYSPIEASGLQARLMGPWMLLVYFVSGLSFLGFLFFMWRILKHLDPSKVVPRRVRNALDTLAEGLLVVDKRNRIVLANDEFCRWMSAEPESMVGRAADDFEWSDQESGEELAVCPWQNVIDQQSAGVHETISLVDASGDRRFLNINASQVMGHNGEFRGALISLDDVTQLEQTRHELKEAVQTAEKANEAKSTFLAQMSHEIRTPMNAILGYTDVLRRGLDQDGRERTDYLNTIHSSGEHLLTLINDILDLSKIESGQMTLENRECSPMELILQVTAILDIRANEKNINLSFVPSGRMPRHCRLDPVRFRQIIMNIAGNAIKFTETGGVTIRLSWDESSGKPDSVSQQSLIVEIEDTGIGISTEAQSTIFEAFSQADTSITRRFGGTGLGLPISRKLAREMGGDITVSSVMGSGSTFRATLACGLDPDVEFVSPEELQQESSNQTRRGPVHDLNGLRLLIADDGDANRKLVSLVAGRAGANVVSVANGQEAVEATRQQQFDLILMDIQMPIMDGYTAANQIRSEGFLQPIIALTANAMAGEETKCRAAGCSGFMTKPIDIDTLLATLDFETRESRETDALPAKTGDAIEDQLLRSVTEIGDSIADDDAATGDQTSADTTSTRSSGSSSKMLNADMNAIYCSLPEDDVEFLEIAIDFLNQFDEKLEELRTAVALSDFECAAAVGHWLKGSAGLAGYEVFEGPAERLEQAARQRSAAGVNTLATRIDLMSRSVVAPTV